MGQKLVWTARRDAGLVALRGAAQSWDAIAGALGISRNAAMERGRRVGARLPPRPVVSAVPAGWRTLPTDRPALPPGHPTSWAVLTAGTLLAGEAYPVPVPLGRERRGVVGEPC